MKLLFLYIENFRVHRNCAFNFDSNERFLYANRTLSFANTSKAKVPDDFFHLSMSSARRGAFAVTSRVDCVSAVIGKNGAGKTSLAEMLNHAFSRGMVEDRFIYVCKVGDKYICRDNLVEKINISPVLDKVGRERIDYQHFCKEIMPPDLGMIYYSPYYSPRDDWFIGSSDGFIDLSTFGKIAGRVQKEYELDESNTIDRFIMKLASRRKSIMRDAPVPIPGQLTVKVNSSFVESTQREIGSVIKDFSTSERKGAVPYHELERTSFGERDPSKITTELEYMQALVCIVKGLGLVRTGDLILQIIAGFIASCIRNIGYDFKVFSGDMLCVKLVSVVSKILEVVWVAYDADRDNGRENMLEVPTCEMWKALDNEARMNIRKSAIDVIASEFPTYFTAGISIDRRRSRNISFDSVKNRAILRFSTFLRDVEELSAGKQLQDGELTLPLLTAKDRKLYLGIKYAYETLQRDLFLKDSASFLDFSAVGMSSGERAYLSMFGRMDEYIGTRPMHGRKMIKNWILFLDEAETALHPAWQRQLVENVIWYVETFTRNLSVHVIFASHSPTLLSDIPKGNVVHLTRGDKDALLGSLEMQTFGANIFDLYRLAFDQTNGPMGAFAKRKIDKALKKIAELVAERRLSYNLNNVDNGNRLRLDDETEATLKLIGDPLIDRYLKSLHEGGLL